MKNNKFNHIFNDIINESIVLEGNVKPELEDVVEKEYDSDLVTAEQLDKLKKLLQDILVNNRTTMSTVKKYAALKSDANAWQSYGFYTGQNSIIKLIFKELGLDK